jgi:hypothetical protein
MNPLTNKLYNAIKYTITILLPAVGTLYFAIAKIWDFNRISGVNGTINALITFGGLLIGYSSRQYKKNGTDGDLVVMQDENGEKHVGLGVNGNSLEEMTNKSLVTLSVVDKTATDPKMQAPEIPSVIPGQAPMTNPATTHVHPHEQAPPPVMPTQS